MNSYGRITRIIITAMVVVLGIVYLGADYLGADVSAESRQLGKLLPLFVMMLVGAAVLLGIFKLVAKLYDFLVQRQSEDNDDNPRE